MDVVVTGEPPTITAGTPVRITGLIQNYWQMEGRDGLTFRAESITPENTRVFCPFVVPGFGFVVGFLFRERWGSGQVAER